MHRYVQRAMLGAEKGAILTQRLLAFARRQSLQPAWFDAGERLMTIMELLRGTLGGAITSRRPARMSYGTWRPIRTSWRLLC